VLLISVGIVKVERSKSINVYFAPSVVSSQGSSRIYRLTIRTMVDV
jgi:hypothetical protein